MESYACILNILLFIRAIALDFVVSLLPTAELSSFELVNLLISLVICSTPKLSK